MNRRASLGKLFGRKQASTKTASAAQSISLDPYVGPWEYEHAAHLLRRATFGPTKAQIDQSMNAGMQNSINFLFQDQAPIAPPVYYNFDNDPLVPNLSTWIDAEETGNDGSITGKRNQSLYAWWMLNMQNSGGSITEKMLLFWHDHFVVISVNKARRRHKYLEFLRANVFGNFRTLLEGITIDSAMLEFLNGHQNSANGPNENYARELLELFAIGKGPTAGPGDYTTYTEDDVVAIARALTGWRANNSELNDASVSRYQANRHDTGEKQLSHRFDNVVITNGEENEYKNVIDLILQKDECARFISRKLIRWFVHTDITSEVESGVVEPMAQMILADNYELKNAMKALMSSQYFYEESIRGCMVASPIDHVYKFINTFELATPEETINKYEIARHFQQALSDTDMAIFEHPTVAGWKAFYQEPQFDKIWINAVSLPLRETFANAFINGYNRNGWRLEIDVIAFAASLDNPSDPNALIRETAAIIFAQPLTDEQVVSLKDLLIPGLPDFEWTVEYGDFASGNMELEAAIDNKLKSLIGTMAKMPEFHLI